MPVTIPHAQPTIKIPDRLNELLCKDDSLAGAVKANLQPFSVWFINSRTPFFPEYTDHGIAHVEATLISSSSLMTDESWDIVTPQDAAVLIMAAILHDSAMHLTEASFLGMIAPESSRVCLSGFGDQCWVRVWEEFLGEAVRFDDRKLMDLFGNTQPARRPPVDPAEWNERDKKLIGELIRKYHCRIAHEVAVLGLPDASGAPALRLNIVEPRMASLAGHVARSHGIPVRAAVDSLKGEFGDVTAEISGTHPAYLMALLRVADYLQMQQERAPRGLMRIRRLCSPLSRKFWDLHEAIADIRTHHSDPEAIYVEARPKSVRGFLAARDLLKDLQRELDESWAVLGEKYGRIPEFKNLGLILRRVRSNINDVGEFAKSVDFVPDGITFEVAHAEVLKLLIGPLYGDRPQIGVRELMQNAVDAVQELRQLQKRRPSLANIELPDQDADVLVEVDRRAAGEWYLTVSDKGVGMTVATVKNYFLRVGASYRQSAEWKRTFEDESGKSSVLRSGRFGIGLMAAFLIGDQIHVSTRFVDEPLGIEFSADPACEAIQLQKVPRSVGTTIRVRLGSNQQKKMEVATIERESSRNSSFGSWFARSDWFCLANPRVLRRNNWLAIDHENAYTIPGALDPLPLGWRRLNHEDYQEIQWTYWQRAPNLSCNGIRLSRSARPSGELGRSDHDTYAFRVPRLSVFDPDGALPLTLTRNHLSSDGLPFKNALSDQVARDFCAFSLVTAPDAYSPPELRARVRYPGCVPTDSWRRSELPLYLVSRRGRTMLSSWHLASLGIGRVLFLARGLPPHIQAELIDGYDAFGYWDAGVSSILFGSDVMGIARALGPLTLEWVVAPRPSLAEARRESLEVRSEGSWGLVNLTRGPSMTSHGAEVLRVLAQVRYRVDHKRAQGDHWAPAIGMKVQPALPTDAPGVVAEGWKTFIRSPTIPFDAQERESLLVDVERDLGEFIRLWRADLPAFLSKHREE